MKIANFKNKKKELFTKQQQETYENAKICKDQFGNKYLKNKKDRKVREHCHYTGEYGDAVHSKCN